MTSILPTAPIRVPQVADAAQPKPAPAPDSEAKAKPVGALYFSPFVKIDPKTGEVAWAVRDPETGDVIRQWPRAHTTNAYQAHQTPADVSPPLAPAATAHQPVTPPPQGTAMNNPQPQELTAKLKI